MAESFSLRQWGVGGREPVTCWVLVEFSGPQGCKIVRLETAPPLKSKLWTKCVYSLASVSRNRAVTIKEESM